MLPSLPSIWKMFRKEGGACCPSPKKEKYVMSGAAPLPHPYCATVYDTTLSALGILHMPTIITRASLRMLKIHSTRCHSYSVTRFISLLTSIPSCAHWIGMGYAQESSIEALVSCWFLCKPVLNTAVLSCLSWSWQYNTVAEFEIKFALFWMLLFMYTSRRLVLYVRL